MKKIYIIILTVMTMVLLSGCWTNNIQESLLIANKNIFYSQQIENDIYLQQGQNFEQKYQDFEIFHEMSLENITSKEKLISYKEQRNTLKNIEIWHIKNTSEYMTTYLRELHKILNNNVYDFSKKSQRQQKDIYTTQNLITDWIQKFNKHASNLENRMNKWTVLINILIDNYDLIRRNWWDLYFTNKNIERDFKENYEAYISLYNEYLNHKQKIKMMQKELWDKIE